MELATDIFRLPKRIALAEAIADSIAQAISARHFVPGERIAEAALAERLGVSRVPVREALKILLAQGIVVGRPNKGYRVAEFNEETVAQVLEVRLNLETILLRDAIRRWRAIDPTARELEEPLKAMHAAAEAEDRPASLMADLDFHRAIASAADNEIARILWEAIARHVLIIFNRREYRDDDLYTVVRQHEAFAAEIRALIKGPDDTADPKTALEDHLLQVVRVRRATN